MALGFVNSLAVPIAACMSSGAGKSGGAWRFAIDRGGTFTDVVATTPDGIMVTDKLLSEDTARYSDAASEAVRRMMHEYGDGPVAELRIGTTVATNALLERKGERTALAITRGFADALRIGTQARPEIFARHIVLPEQLPERVIEIAERVAADGEVLHPLDEAAVRADLLALREDGFDALAIVLMHGWTHTDHETRLAQIALEAGFVQVSASHEVSPLIKLIPRGDTTVVDAYLSPVLRRYVDAYAQAFRPYVEAPMDVLTIRCTAIVGAAEALSGVMLRNEIEEREAVSTLFSLITSWFGHECETTRLRS